MLIYIRHHSAKADAPVVEAVPLGDIVAITPVTNEAPDVWRYSVRLNGRKDALLSAVYTSAKQAEAAQVAAVATLNALEVYYERLKHIERDTPMLFNTVDPATGKFITGRISYQERPVYTIEL